MNVNWLFALRDFAILWTTSFLTGFLVSFGTLVGLLKGPDGSTFAQQITNATQLVAFILAASLGRTSISARFARLIVVSIVLWLLLLQNVFNGRGLSLHNWSITLWGNILLMSVGIGISIILAPPVAGQNPVFPKSTTSDPVNQDLASTAKGNPELPE